MKNVKNAFSCYTTICVIVLAAIIGFSFTACPTDGGDDDDGGAGATVTSISIATLPTTVYFLNESFSSVGLAINSHLSDGSIRPISSG